MGRGMVEVAAAGVRSGGLAGVLRGRGATGLSSPAIVLPRGALRKSTERAQLLAGHDEVERRKRGGPQTLFRAGPRMVDAHAHDEPLRRTGVGDRAVAERAAPRADRQVLVLREGDEPEDDGEALTRLQAVVLRML